MWQGCIKFEHIVATVHEPNGQRQTKHDWDGAGDGDKNRVQMTNDERDDANDSQALTGGNITKFRALAGRIRYLSQAMANPSASDLERVKRIGRYIVETPRVESLFHGQQSGEVVAYSYVDWRGDQAGVTMRGGHCLKVWKQVVSVSTAGSEMYPQSKTASEGFGIRSCAWSTAEGQAWQNTSTCRTCGTTSLQVEHVRHHEGENERKPR